MIIAMPKQTRRSKQEIAEELHLLWTLLNQVPSTTAFGDDNCKAIRAQIHVLDQGLTLVQIEDRYEDGDDYTLSAALNALEWLRDGDSPPSEDWWEMVAA